MHQVMKKRLYGKGNEKQIRWVIEYGGLDAEEETMLRAWHKKLTDEDIEALMHIDKDKRKDIEDMMVPKICAALLHAIDYTMAHEKTE